MIYTAPYSYHSFTHQEKVLKKFWNGKLFSYKNTYITFVLGHLKKKRKKKKRKEKKMKKRKRKRKGKKKKK